MFYRETGQFKNSYVSDQTVFPIRQDLVFVTGVILIAYLIVPFLINDYWTNAILLPFLVYALASMGLNILKGLSIFLENIESLRSSVSIFTKIY